MAVLTLLTVATMLSFTFGDDVRLFLYLCEHFVALVTVLREGVFELLVGSRNWLLRGSFGSLIEPPWLAESQSVFGWFTVGRCALLRCGGGRRMPPLVRWWPSTLL